MGKKRNWFSLVKKLFSAKPKPKDGKKSRGWRWVFGGHNKKQYPTLLAPQRTIHEAREEQRKQAMAVAIAMAAAAEAAVAAAHAASEVVHLTGVPQSYQEYEKMTRYSAAVKIQAAYRAHLARKALKALKGLVRLQALVRGRIVRRRVLNKLKCVKCLPPTAMTQPHVVREIRVPTADASCKDKINQQFLSLKEELEEERKKLRCNSGKNWDHSIFSKEDMEAVWLRKQEAAVKRECMKRYSFSHRERRYDQDLETLIPTKENGRLSNQFEQRVDFEPSKRRQTSNLKSSFGSNSVFSDTYRATQFKLKNMHKRDSIEELNSPFSLPRRSFSHTKQKSFGDESSLPNSPNFPTYMATTESAKAKVRSMSTPRQRLGLFDTYTDYNSPCKLRLSTWSTFNGGFSSINGSRRRPEQISLSIKGLH